MARTRDPFHSRAILAGMVHLDALAIFGDNYVTPDGTATRDYVHVSDLNEAYVVAARRLLGVQERAAVNLSSVRGLSVLEIVDAGERVTGLAVPYRIVPRGQGDPAVLVADGSRAEHLLGCSPEHPDIETIVRTAHGWLAR